jgi:hypothetical protein
MKKIVVLIMISLFFGCNKKEDSEVQKPYIISAENIKIQKYSDSLKSSGSKIKLLPLEGFYGECNLIIDRNGDALYFQNKNVVIMCGTGIENDTIPKFIDLQPKDLIKIPKDCMEKFIDENVMTKEKRRQILIIASQTDTINDQKILSFFYNMKVPTYLIRRTTQEEDTVLSYKKKNSFYSSDEIKWDKSRIKLPENVKFSERLPKK